VAAQTGSGKTLAFAAPILSELLKLKTHLSTPRLPQRLLALVLTPTRELAQQIEANIGLALSVVNQGKSPIDQLKVACIIGGISKEKQLRILRQRKPQILIGTPGRLHELLGDEVLDFSQLKYLVVDEADRMIEMGHFKEID
jgi:superfamily II DNA/RNA helicase